MSEDEFEYIVYSGPKGAYYFRVYGDKVAVSMEQLAHIMQFAGFHRLVNEDEDE